LLARLVYVPFTPNAPYALLWERLYFSLVCCSPDSVQPITHYAPDNQTLLWDRLPMTVAFMALYVALLGHCFDRQLAQRFLPLALLTGAASVLYWSYSESRGAGDLRYYAVVQFLPMLLIPTLLLRWPPKALRVSYLWSMLLLYLAAKLCEYFDDTLAGHLPFLLTGHALKHLFSGAAGFVFVGARSHAQISPQE
jgi:hypothetical protein